MSLISEKIESQRLCFEARDIPFELRHLVGPGELTSLYENQSELASIKEKVRTFFSFLDEVEETDEGREFHPVTISCCRCLWVEPLNKAIVELKEAVK